MSDQALFHTLIKSYQNHEMMTVKFYNAGIKNGEDELLGQLSEIVIQFNELIHLDHANQETCVANGCKNLDCFLRECTSGQSKVQYQKKYSAMVRAILNFQCDRTLLIEFFDSVSIDEGQSPSPHLMSVVYHNIAMIMFRFHDLEKTIRYFEKSMDGTKKRGIVYYNIATVKSRQNKHLEAIEYHNKSIKEGHRYSALYNQGFAYNILGMKEEKIRCFEELDRLLTQDQARHKYLDCIVLWGENRLFNLMKAGDAIEVFEKGLTIAEQDRHHYPDETLGKFYYGFSVAHFTRAREFHENDTNRFSDMNQARIYMDQALTFLQKEENKEDKIADLHFLAGNYAEAEIHALANLERDPTGIDANKTCGQIYLELGKSDMAIKYLKNALIYSKGESQIREYLAEAYRKNKEYYKAMDEAMQVLRRDVFNKNVLTVLANLHIDLAEITHDEDSFEKESNLEKAKDYLHKIISNNRKLSSPLTRPELSYLYFLLGYVSIKLYSYNRTLASYHYGKLYFNKVEPDSDHYYKARNLLSKIRNHRKTETQKTRKGRSIILIGCIIGVITLFAFIFGKPVILPFYSVDQEKLAKEVTQGYYLIRDSATLDTTVFYKRYISPQSAELSMKLGGIMKNDTVRTPGVIIREHELGAFEHINEPFLFSSFLATVLLIVLGIIFSEVKSVKLPGGIEIEKNTLDVKMNPTAFKIDRD